jgi:hypothetical protein
MLPGECIIWGMLRLALLALLCAAACTEEPLALDFALPDLALEPLDLTGGIPDLSERQRDDGAVPTHCQLDSDCRLFASSCMTCHCVALTQSAPFPTCPPQELIDCTAQPDPCGGHTAKCVASACVVQ